VSAARFSRWAISATFGGFLFGYHAAVVAGALLSIRRDFGLDNFEQGVLVSLLPLGAVLGSLLNGPIAERLGRRKTLILDAAVFIAGTAIAVAAPDYGALLVGRALTGIAVGSTLATVPLYLSEISPPSVRGRLVTANQVMITFGIVVAYAIDLAFAGSGSWRAMFVVGLLPALALLVGMLHAPESPAAAADDVESTKGRMRDFLTPGARPALVIGISLAVIQQFSGINAVIYYAPSILERTGLNASNSILYSVIVGAANVAATLVALQVVDRVGRRPLLLGSLFGMLVSLTLLGLTFEVAALAGSWLTLACLLGYIVSFAIGLGPVFWLLIAEIFPPRGRAAGVGVAAAVAWLANFTVGLAFLPIAQAVGEGPTFWIFAGVCLIGIAFVALYVPETKQRSLVEISNDLHLRWHDGSARMKRRVLTN
jgi:MFS transporter, SP family, galactose:H+ symporter